MQTTAQPGFNDVRVSAIGYFTPSQLDPHVVVAGDAVLPPDLGFAQATEASAPEDGLPSLQFGDRLHELRRASGVQRHRSAANATIWAATLASRLLEQLRPDVERSRVGVSMVSTSATFALGYAFERRGITEGWDLVDPAALPNTVPTAIATQLAIAFQLQAFAVVCSDGFLGAMHGVELAAHLIARGDADAALVIAAEELTPIQLAAYRSLDLTPCVSEGSSGLLLERHSPSDKTGWLIKRVSEGCAADVDASPMDWGEAQVTDYTVNTTSSMHSLMVPAVLSGVLANCSERRAVLRTIHSTRGWRAIEFERAESFQ